MRIPHHGLNPLAAVGDGEADADFITTDRVRLADAVAPDVLQHTVAAPVADQRTALAAATLRIGIADADAIVVQRNGKALPLLAEVVEHGSAARRRSQHRSAPSPLARAEEPML